MIINEGKTGKFIASLRKEKKLSQEQLGNIIGIGRDSISKWERGVSLPSYEMLIALSNEFDVSINEIFYGERINKVNKKEINEVPLTLYENVKKKNTIIKILFVIILCFLSLFGLYYFINSYKSVKIYNVYGDGKNAYIKDGVFIRTREKNYFSINEIILNKEYDIKSVTLYYKDMDKYIFKGDSDNILISDIYGSNEYFNVDYLDDITDNLSLFVEYEDGTSETINLYMKQDYVNNKLFFRKGSSVVTKTENNSYIN